MVMLFDQTRIQLVGKIANREQLIAKLKDNGATVIDEQSAETDKEVIYIADNFSGPTFEQLKSSGAHIVSTQCVHESIKEGKALPKLGHPVYCRILEGLSIAYTDQCKGLAKLIEYMCGRAQADIYSSTNYLIASDVISPLYHQAVRKSVPIVQPVWIQRCWDTKTLCDPLSFLLPPFAGCKISVTGLNNESRTMIEQLASLHGGLYVSTLSVDCTHLIADKPSGLKYKFAMMKKIPTVTPEWFFDSVRNNVCADPSKYRVSTNLFDLYNLSALMDNPITGTDVESVIHHIDKIINKVITISTVCELLEKATIRNQPRFKTACLRFISEHYQDVLRTEGYAKLDASLKNEINSVDPSLLTSTTTTTSSKNTLQASEELLESAEPDTKKRKSEP